MKPQSFKRLVIEDFEEKDRPLVTKLAYSINVSMEEIINILNKNLSIEDNLSLQKRDITVTVDSGGVPITSISVKTNLSSSCQGLQVIKAICLDDLSLTPSHTPFITFSDQSGLIKISKITGLQANKKYSLRIILYP